MITNITIKNVASYKNPVELTPSKINYIYGGNGTGKTTLSRIIFDKSRFPECLISYSDPSIERLVYNRDFVKRNFSQIIPSIFSLGEDSVDIENQIIDKRKNLEQLKEFNNTKRTTIDNFRAEIKDQRDKAVLSVWEEEKNTIFLFSKHIQVLETLKKNFLIRFFQSLKIMPILLH